MIMLHFQMILIIRGICLSVGGVFEKHALDTISFPDFRESFRAKHGWFQAHLCTLNVQASRELPPLPIPLSSIYMYEFRGRGDMHLGC